MKKSLIPLIGLTLALAVAGIFAGFTLSDGSGSPAQDPTATSIDDIDPNVCNLMHNRKPCTPEELGELGIAPTHGDPEPPVDGSVSVDNPDTGGGAIGVPDPRGQGTDIVKPPLLHGDPEPSVVRTGSGTVLLIDPLLATGAEVNLTGEVVSEDPFQVDGRVLEVNGERVLVMNYGDAAALEAEAAGISPDGSSVGTHMVTWVGPPHFFRTETAIVLYVGESPTLIEALTKMMGPQFAGR